jgi:hypothetical protein
MRQSLGTAVFSGMLGVTLFGLVFTPVFYVLSRSFAARGKRTTVPVADESDYFELQLSGSISRLNCYRKVLLCAAVAVI